MANKIRLLFGKIKNKFSDDSSARIAWVDIAKGIAVYCVFLGHIWYSSNLPILNTLFYSFHTPIFFIISGFLFKKKSGQNFWQYFKRILFRILIPTAIYMLVGLLVAICIKHIYDPLTLVKLYFYWDGKFVYNAPCWCFIALFIIYLVAYFVDVSNMKTVYKLFIAFLFFVIGFFIYSQEQYITELAKAAKKTVKLIIPFGLDKTIIAFGFFSLGAFFKDLRKLTPESLRMTLMSPVFVISPVIWVLFGVTLNSKTSFYGMALGNYWYFVLGAIFGTISIIGLSIFISKIPVLSHLLSNWGQNSLFIIGTHYVSQIGFVAIFVNAMKKVKLTKTLLFNVYAPLYVLAILISYTIVCFIINRYLPHITGTNPYFYKRLIQKYKEKRKDS